MAPASCDIGKAIGKGIGKATGKAIANTIAKEAIGFYGGTFDPIHRGHVHAAQSVLASLDFEKIHLVLSARPGHRGAPASTIQERWDMLCLACAHDEQLIADDREIRRAGKSYTYDTVKEVYESGYLPNWVVGMDSFITMPEWYRWREILDYCNLIIIQRPGSETTTMGELEELMRDRSVDELSIDRVGQIVRHTAAMLDVSATEIRTLIQANGDASDLLDKGVWSYIRQHNLYVEVSV